MAITLESGVEVGLIENSWPRVVFVTRIGGGALPKDFREIVYVELDCTGYPPIADDLMPMFIDGCRIELRRALFVNKGGFTPAEIKKWTTRGTPCKIVLSEYFESKKTRKPAELTAERVAAKIDDDDEIKRTIALLEQKLRNKAAMKELNERISPTIEVG